MGDPVTDTAVAKSASDAGKGATAAGVGAGSAAELGAAAAPGFLDTVGLTAADIAGTTIPADTAGLLGGITDATSSLAAGDVLNPAADVLGATPSATSELPVGTLPAGTPPVEAPAATSTLPAGTTPSAIGTPAAGSAVAPTGGGAGGSAAIPEVTITAPAAGAGAGAGIGDVLAPLGAGAAAGAALSGSPAPSPASSPTAPTVQDIAPGAAGDVSSFISPGGLTSITPDLADQLGLSAADLGGSPGVDLSSFLDTGDYSAFEDPNTLQPIDLGSLPQKTGPGAIQSLLDKVSGKGLAQGGLLGLSALNALSKPKIPGASQTALNAAVPQLQEAEMVVKTGGQGSPLWPQQKAAIDAAIDQQTANAVAALKQQSANAGMGGNDSEVVQAQIADIQAKATAQKQQIYAQQLDNNVKEAITLITGADNVLTQIGATQLQESNAARSAASQTAELALLLGSGASNFGNIFGTQKP